MGLRVRRPRGCWLTEGGVVGLAPGSPAAFDEGAQLGGLGKLRHQWRVPAGHPARPLMVQRG